MKFYVKYLENGVVAKLIAIGPTEQEPADCVEITKENYHLLLSRNQDLSGIQFAALDCIDKKSGEIRLRFITDVPGQPHTYTLKIEEAKLLTSNNYVCKDLAMEYPMLAGEVVATGNPDLPSLCQEILGLAESWRHVAAAIERERRSGKISVSRAQNPEEVDAELRAALDALEAISTAYLS